DANVSGLISLYAISSSSPSEGPAPPVYFRPVAFSKAGPTTFSFRYTSDAAYAMLAVPLLAVPELGLLLAPPEPPDGEELPQPAAASPMQVIAASTPRRAPRLFVRDNIPRM